MIRLASIIKEYEPDFIKQYSKQLLPSHYKALNAIKTCRSEYGPQMLMQCENEDCSHITIIPHSCGHRHCPYCQNYETGQWIDNQLKKLVPAVYFMITFTLPAQLRNLAWQNQRLVYGLFFDCVWETIRTFCLNDKKLGGIPGAVAVLHTNSRELNYHPHIHLVMPAATIDKNKRLWSKKSGKYLFNHKALAKVFREKMIDALTNNNLTPPRNNPKKWVADCLFVGHGNKALLYLGKYLYRGVIKEDDIISFENGKVTFRFTNSKTKQTHTKTVSAVQFLWMIFQHILPRSFRRVRNFGFLHPNSKKLIKILQWLFRLDPSRFTGKKLEPRKRMICPLCGAFMNILAIKLPASAEVDPDQLVLELV